MNRDADRFAVLKLVCQNASSALGIRYLATSLLCIINQYANGEHQEVFVFSEASGYRAQSISSEHCFYTSIAEAEQHVRSLIRKYHDDHSDDEETDRHYFRKRKRKDMYKKPTMNTQRCTESGINFLK